MHIRMRIVPIHKNWNYFSANVDKQRRKIDNNLDKILGNRVRFSSIGSGTGVVRMRVITGFAKGRKLRTLSGEDVRPTTDRVKEALFSIIQFEIEGRRVLDLFAGSGQLGIEALSRGAASAVFVDSSRDSIEVVRENLNTTQLAQSAQVMQMDSLAFLAGQCGPFDIALLDPPYGAGLVQRALPMAARRMAPGGVMICEAPAKEDLPEQAEDFCLLRRYSYGRISLAFYRREGEGA